MGKCHLFAGELLISGLCRREREWLSGAVVWRPQDGERQVCAQSDGELEFVRCSDGMGKCWVSDCKSIVLTVDCAFVLANVAGCGFQCYWGTRREDCVFCIPYLLSMM